MSRPTLLSLWLGFLIFVVYGSLIPFDFRPLPLEQAWATFLQTPYLNLGLESRADWVSNGVLYVPLGYLSATLFMRTERPGWHLPPLLLATVFCCAVAFGVEFTQLFFPPRTVSQNDLYAESIGSVLGVVVAPFLLPWFRRLNLQWSLGGEQLQRYLLQAYAVGYVLLCLFPFDFLLSQAELLGKLNSNSWGWLLAGSAERPALVALQLAVEIVLAVPIGFLLARRAGSGFWPGVVLGLAIEGVQFFIETAVSQGLSVVTRTLAVMIGVALWRRRATLGADFWAGWIRRTSWLLVPAYALALSVANGWSVMPWHSLTEAIAQWHTVELLPFYYHYFTTEARALVSLGFVALMYLPLAVFVWANQGRIRHVVLLSGAGSLLIETSKLFLTGSRPDPTNVIIAMVACASILKGLEVLTRVVPALAAVPASPTGVEAFKPAAPVSSFTADSLTTGTGHGNANGHAVTPTWKYFLLAPVLTIVGVQALLFPAFAPALCLLLLACACAVWLRPVLALAIIPAALPVLDLAPWSGRFFWDEFDLLTIVCLAVACVRARSPRSKPAPWDALGLSLLLLAFSLALSTAMAMWPWPALAPDSFANYDSPYNALRIIKGGLWAWSFVLLYGRLADLGDKRALVFSRGMQCGLALTLLWILWERAAFVGLFDFAADYRITGPISAMHKGGAYIECYLAVASAFALGALLQARTFRSRLSGGMLLLGATYGVMVTYSRNGYAALAVIVLVMLGAHLLTGPLKPRRMAALAGMLALMLIIAAPILSGPYARARLGATGNDLAVRAAHWRDALAMRDSGWQTTLAGVGVGRFPDQHFWRSNEAAHAATYSIKEEKGNRYLRLGAGSPLYLEQIVSLEPGRDYVLSARVRSNQPNAELAVMLCQKWMLTSARCEPAILKTGPTANAWLDVQATLKAGAPSDQPWYARRPLKLALVTPTSKITLDVDNLHFAAAPMPDVLRNGDFSAGLDRWFFTTDVDPPWHIHSLPVAILFDQGWLGVLAWTLVCGLALYSGVRRMRRGSVAALTATAALLGFLVSGSLNTLIDAPRFLWLLLCLAWLCRGDDDRPPASNRRRRRTVRPA